MEYLANMAVNFEISNSESKTLFQSLVVFFFEKQCPNYNYLLREKIGSGTFGNVFRVIFFKYKREFT